MDVLPQWPCFALLLEELLVVDIKFLHGCAQPTIVLLYQDTKDNRHVKTYEISVKDKEFVDGPWGHPDVERTASLLIPVPQPLGGVLVVGEGAITYLNGTVTKSITIDVGTMLSWGSVDSNGSRYLLGDSFGGLYVLVLNHDRGWDLKVEKLGETSISSSISYLDNGVVFVGSSYGDSQLVKLNSAKDEQGSYINILENYTNLAPIVDFVVVDLDRQGQGQVITCLGAFKDGSLRIIRNGIGINEQASIDLPGIKGIWSLKQSSEQSAFDKYLIVSFVGATSPHM